MTTAQDDERTPFARLIRRYREMGGWTQEQLAQNARIGRDPVGKAETAKGSEEASIYNARAIVGALHSNPKRLYLRRRDLEELAAVYLLPDLDRASFQQSPVIGLSISSVGHGSFWPQAVAAIEEYAVSIRGWRVILCQHRHNIAAELAHLKFLATLDPLIGVLMSPAVGIEPHTDEQLGALDDMIGQLKQRGIPTVFIGRRVPIPTPVPMVGPDDRAGAALAVRYLYDHDHRRIGLIQDLPHHSAQQERLRGYLDVIEGEGLSYRAVLAGQDVPDGQRAKWEQEHGWRYGRTNALDMLGRDDRPTAIFATTASTALAVREAAEILNIPIPASLSLIGYDQHPALDASRPRIARVTYDVEDLARRATSMLRRLVDSKGDAESLADDRITKFAITPPDTPSVARLNTNLS